MCFFSEIHFFFKIILLTTLFFLFFFFSSFFDFFDSNVNIADSSGTFTERRKLGISPANAVDGYHIRWAHPYTNLDSTVHAPYFRFQNATGKFHLFFFFSFFQQLIIYKTFVHYI